MEDHNIFYIPAGSIGGRELVIKGSQLTHIRKVLRKRAGEYIYLTDGQGYQYEAEITSLGPSSMTARINHKKHMPRRPTVEITLGFVPVKGLRNDTIIEKGTELGVVRFIIFQSRRSVVRNMSRQKFDRLIKIAQSAMVQSKQYYMPEIVIVKTIDDLFAPNAQYDQMYVAESTGQMTLPMQGRRILLLIGPEGGFAKSEIDAFADHGVRPISLGRTRLRSETAAIVGIAKILAAYGQI